MRSGEPVDPLVLDLLEWIGPRSRTYAETIEAWKTSCPRLTVWEDASDQGLVARRCGPGRDTLISITAAGADLLKEYRPVRP
jgi:hypothetical protein